MLSSSNCILNAHSTSTAVVLFAVSMGIVLFRSTKNGRKNLLKWTNNNTKDEVTPNSPKQGNNITNSSGSAAYDCFPPLPQEVVNLLRYISCILFSVFYDVCM